MRYLFEKNNSWFCNSTLLTQQTIRREGSLWKPLFDTSFLFPRDFELIKWIGANSFRTSHYPYAEEIMDFADRNGIMVIDECPGVNLHTFDEELLINHQNVMEELIYFHSHQQVFIRSLNIIVAYSIN